MLAELVCLEVLLSEGGDRQELAVCQQQTVFCQTAVLCLSYRRGFRADVEVVCSLVANSFGQTTSWADHLGRPPSGKQPPLDRPLLDMASHRQAIHRQTTPRQATDRQATARQATARQF